MGSEASRQKLPAYNDQLEAYHAAFAAELEAIVGELPIQPGARVLDAACGDGTYTFMLARRVGAGGLTLGLDLCRAYLARARQRWIENGREPGIEFVAGSFEKLPYEKGSFDLVWCAQSLYSLPDPVAALTGMRELARPGGMVAVLENDSLHGLLLPWAAGLEMQVRLAEYEALREATGQEEKYYVSRNLWAICQQAGLRPARYQTVAFDRHGPLGEAEKKFLREHLERLIERIRPHLAPGVLERVRGLADPNNADSFLNGGWVTMTCLNTVLWGVREE